MKAASRRLGRILAGTLLVVAAAAGAAPFSDSMAQRVLACTGCHGPQGRAAADGYYPRLAGKPAGYLFNQLLNFRDGRRPYRLMSELLAPLDDAYLKAIAEHFAGLELPYPAPAGAALPDDRLRTAVRLVRRGDPARSLPACASCHGEAMTGIAPFVPGLLGLPPDYLNAQLGAWRAGKRQAQAPDCMAAIARALAPDEIAALSSWLAAQPVPQPARAAEAFVTPPPIPCGGVAETAAPPAATGR